MKGSSTEAPPAFLVRFLHDQNRAHKLHPLALIAYLSSHRLLLARAALRKSAWTALILWRLIKHTHTSLLYSVDLSLPSGHETLSFIGLNEDKIIVWRKGYSQEPFLQQKENKWVWPYGPIGSDLIKRDAIFPRLLVAEKFAPWAGMWC